MTEILVIAFFSFIASGLTLFSGFGLGTLLMPIVAIFFPIQLAIAITAIVHLLNNFFKFLLLGKFASKKVVLKFGIPAIIAAIIGAFCLTFLNIFPPIFNGKIFSIKVEILPINLIIGLLILLFTFIESSKRFSEMKISQKYLPLGGFLSGFFGGLSGHQGAFRSIFLLKSNLSKEEFVGTNIIISMFVDITRMSIYGFVIFNSKLNIDYFVVSVATIFAFLGAYVGSRFLEKITINTIQKIVSIFLVIISIGLIFGFF